MYTMELVAHVQIYLSVTHVFSIVEEICTATVSAQQYAQMDIHVRYYAKEKMHAMDSWYMQTKQHRYIGYVILKGHYLIPTIIAVFVVKSGPLMSQERLKLIVSPAILMIQQLVSLVIVIQ